MDKQLLDEVIACLPEGRTFFHYHRDRYVLLLLGQLARAGRIATVADLRRTPFAHWLQKGFVKRWLAAQGRADLPVEHLLQHWPTDVPHDVYLLSLGRWGRDRRDTWRQTSRPGWNLVLHLNLPLVHRRQLDRAGAADLDRLQWRCHPRDGHRLTLAWARIDLDFASGEALVEEVQSDWIRRMAQLQARALRHQGRGDARLVWQGMELDTAAALDYAAGVVTQEKHWQEAMLAATLWFLWQELGIGRVFYHRYETSLLLKHFDAEWSPPRSLYTDLPERFGFRLVDEGPGFIEADRQVRALRRRARDWRWYQWADSGPGAAVPAIAAH